MYRYRLDAPVQWQIVGTDFQTIFSAHVINNKVYLISKYDEVKTNMFQTFDNLITLSNKGSLTISQKAVFEEDGLSFYSFKVYFTAMLSYVRPGWVAGQL